MVGTREVLRPPRAKSEDKEKASPFAKRKLSFAFLQVGAGDRRNNEPEYEEVGPPTHLRKIQDNRGDGQNCCDLCGSAPAAVRCDRCGSQAFCLSCDDMYHRHPRRSTHVRKAVDSKSTTGGGVRPPLPPKEVQVGVSPPQPPPRKNKRSGFLSSSAFTRKDQKYARPGTVAPRSTSMTNLQSAASDGSSSAGRTIMGSLKRFMGARPLPPTPDQTKGPVKNDTMVAPQTKALSITTNSPSLPNLNDHIDEEIRTGLPQSVLDLNKTVTPNATSASTPATPASAHAQYPPLQPKTPQPTPNTHSLGRKFSLQPIPQSIDDKRTSMVEPASGGVPWEGETTKPPPRTRSQSISDDQWAQVMAAQTSTSTAVSTATSAGPACPPGHTPADMSAFAGATTRRGYNTITSSGRGGGGTLGRGMVSSASVCDLNTLAQQQPQPALNSTHAANSFQQLNMMGYGGGMVWGAPCDLCQVMPMYPGHPNATGMKRAASNLSMNLSSIGSDVSGYPWAPPPPHIHHHMPMYPGYYPGYHPHMAPPPMGSAMGLNMSIPDSMHTFSKVPSSPAPSVRSSSHRSHKSTKSRSFSAADTSGRRSRNRRMKRSEESEDSRSSSVSEDDDDDDRESKSCQGGGSSLAWQCDHCTFINSGGTRTCGMCSKTVGSCGRSSRRSSERRRSERRRDRRTDPEENDRDVSDYDNDGGGVVKSNLSFNIKDSKRESRTKVTGSNKGKSKKKSRRRGSSASASESKSEGEEEERLERHMRDLRVSSSSSRRRGSDHDGVNSKDKDRDRDRGSRKKEGNVGRFKNRGKSHSERSRTPGRQTPRRASPADDVGSLESSSDHSDGERARSSQHNSVSADRNGHHNSLDGTLVETLASEVTVRTGRKSKSDSSEQRSKSKSSKASSQASSVADEEQVLEQPPQIPVVDKKLSGENSRSPSPKLRVQKSRSPELSQRTSRGEGDDPSFANTLDDIATMGTNEVADQDLSSHYIDDRPRSADLLVAPHEDIPVVNYIRPITPEEEVIDEPKTVAVEPTPIRQVEPQRIEMKNEPEVVAVQDTGQVEKKTEPEQLYEPSYELVEQPVEIEAPVMMEVKPTINVRETNQQEQGDHLATVEAPVEELKLEEPEGVNAENIMEVKVKQESPIDIRGEVRRSVSPGSSLGFNSSPPDRQYTPLSFSSSDAQFYSPPDSPDISLSEQLQDKPQTGQTQAERQSKTMKWGLEDVNEKFLTVEEIITKRRQEAMRKQGLHLVQVLRDAEDLGYASEDVSIALTHCGDKNPLEWLKENWRHMVDTVSTLATNYGQERRVNDVGSITAAEARTSLRAHKGNIWAAVTECVEQRQKKFNEIYSRGRFTREAVVRALETHDGDADSAFLELNRSQLQPFMMKIWNPLQGQENAVPKTVPSTPAPVEVQDPAPSSTLLDVKPTPSQLDLPRPTQIDVPHPAQIDVPHPVPVDVPRPAQVDAPRPSQEDVLQAPTRTDAIKDTSQTQQEFDEEEEEEETDDEDDVFENTYANIDPVKEEPPKEEPIYATVQKTSKVKAKETDTRKFRILAKRDDRPQDRRPQTPNRIDMTTVDDDEVFSASEVAGLESDEDLEEFEDSEEDESDSEREEPQESRGVALVSPTTPSDQMDALSDSASGESQEKEEEAKDTLQEAQTLQYVRKEESEGEESEEPGESEELEEPQETEESQETEETQGRPKAWLPLDEPGMAQTRTGPVTLQKATVIVGKAIAKAMARETSARESNSRSVTPEVQEAPVATPEPSEDEEEITVQVTASDSDDEDHLRTLDTILEEEEISEMTESGRVISRPTSKNLFLPFNPTDVVQLSPVERFLKAVAEPKTSAVSSKDLPDGGVSVTSKDAAEVGIASVLDPDEEKTSKTPQSYYSAPHTYYNEAAATQLAEEQIIKLAPDDYETMYEVKRQLDSLRDTSSATLDKINALVSEPFVLDQEDDEGEEIYYEEVTPRLADVSSKDPSEAESELSSALNSSKRRRRRRRRKGRGSSSDAGASSRAEVSESSVASSSPAPPSPGAPSPVQTPSPVVATPSPVPPTPSPIPAPAEASPASAQEDATEEVVPTVTIKTIRKRPTPSDDVASASQPKEDSSSPVKTEPAESGSFRRRRRRDNITDDTATSSTPDTQPASTSTPAPSTSSTTDASPARRTRKTSLPESSGESEDEDRVEGLKARHNQKNPDYQEVRELKEQIQMMRRQLEARIEDADDRSETPESPKEEQPPKDTETVPQESPEKPVSREYEQLLFDRKVRRLLAEGRAGSYEKAELAAQLLTFNFDETDSLQAAEECSSIYTAIQFLQQECELCAEKYPMRKMMSMLQCTHRCCCECAKTYFTFQIKTKNIREVRCPFCSEPDLDANEEIANEYLNNMDILLKNILDEETHELFQRKLRDWTLMKDPNFRWCNKCSSGFIANPRARKLICPDCKDVTCAHCRASWEATHEGISCEAFARWKTENDAEIAAQGVAKHLAECGITCPKCKFTYALAKGGCMHFTCTQCKYEFCSGCSQPFRQGSKCPVGPYCERLGLHAHHPRNCLFYLRDKEPQQLQNLLKEAGVSYDTEPQGMQEQKTGVRPVCQVQEQKELPDGLKDDICGRVVPSGYAGLCRLHYTEYLVEKINAHKLDPVSIFDEADLRVCLRRNGKTVPIRRWESEKLYRDKLIKLIKEHLPLSSLE